MGESSRRKQELGAEYGGPKVVPTRTEQMDGEWQPHTEPKAKSDKHHYILVHEDGRIETVVCKRLNSTTRKGDLMEHLDEHGLDGRHVINTNQGDRLNVRWRDAGSMDGSAINHTVSNLCGFTVYGPCMFSQSTGCADGLNVEQYTSLMSQLKSASRFRLTAEQCEALVDHNLQMLEIPAEQWAAMDLAEFRKGIGISNALYGYVRQVDKRFRGRYLYRLNSVRSAMRAACDGHKDEMQIIIGFAPEESESL